MFNEECVSTFDNPDVANTTVQPGYPCRNFTGYCSKNLYVHTYNDTILVYIIHIIFLIIFNHSDNSNNNNNNNNNNNYNNSSNNSNSKIIHFYGDSVPSARYSSVCNVLHL